MDWGRLKTIFIIAFLTLDVFLLTQLVNKQQHNQLDVKADVSLEENLNNDNIDYSGLPKDPVRDTYMSANTKIFSESEMSALKEQKVTNPDGSAILSELEKPFKLSEKHDKQEIDQFVKNNVLYGDMYDFGSYDKENGKITYYQKYKDKLLFDNKSAHLILHVNKNKEINSYEQTMLQDIKPISDKEEVLSAMRAVEVIYRKDLLDSGSKVTGAELGYYTVVNMEETQVLTPTWRITVEHNKSKETVLINAFEGHIFQESDPKAKKVME